MYWLLINTVIVDKGVVSAFLKKITFSSKNTWHFPMVGTQGLRYSTIQIRLKSPFTDWEIIVIIDIFIIQLLYLVGILTSSVSNAELKRSSIY